MSFVSSEISKTLCATLILGEAIFIFSFNLVNPEVSFLIKLLELIFVFVEVDLILFLFDIGKLKLEVLLFKFVKFILTSLSTFETDIWCFPGISSFFF